MKTILVPTDFSSSARNAVTYAAALGKAMKAKLLLYHSFQIQVPSTDFPVVTLAIGELTKKSEKTLQKEAARIRKRFKVNVETYTQSGFNPSEEIVLLAKKLKPELVIMGMKRKSAITQILAGSTATAVMRNIKVPVMIIPEKGKFTKPEKILLAFDYSSPAEKNVLAPLCKIAKEFQSEVYVVNIVENGKYSEVEKSRSYVKLNKSLRGIKHVYYFPKSDNFRQGIDEFLTKHKAVMIAMIPHRHNLIERIFGKSNTKNIAFHTTIPMLALPDKHKTFPAYFI